MGQRHLLGISQLKAFCNIVTLKGENEPNLLKTIQDNEMNERIKIVSSFEELDSDLIFDAAILSCTANRRLERVKKILSLGIPNLLIEKPIEQSRESVREIMELVRGSETSAWCNFVSSYCAYCICEAPEIWLM